MKLSRCFWLGGSPCAGKSSIAGVLAEQHGLGLYQCDEAYQDHLKRGAKLGWPIMQQFAGWSTQQIFLRPVAEMVRDVLEFYRQEWPLIVEDIASLEHPKGLIVEGAALLPELVAQIKPEHAVWVVPTESFQRHHYGLRAWARGVVEQTSSPEQAFENWMQRDARFAQLVCLEARQLGFAVLVVDGLKSQGANTGWVAGQWGLL